jgi:hypothetical protein
MAISAGDVVILRQAVERQLADLDNQRAELQGILQRLNGDGRPQKREKPAANIEGKPRRRKRAMSAAERKAIGERMRKYWAQRRKAAAK